MKSSKKQAIYIDAINEMRKYYAKYKAKLDKILKHKKKIEEKKRENAKAADAAVIMTAAAAVVVDSADPADADCTANDSNTST